MKIIKIDGFSGLLTAAFIGCCLFAGFVIFPGYVSMHYWNKYLVNLLEFPQLSLFQGVLLWGIIFSIYYIVSKGNLPVSFQNPQELSDAELNMIMKNAKIHSKMYKKSALINKSDKFIKTLNRNPYGEDKQISINQSSDNNNEDKKTSNLK